MYKKYLFATMSLIAVLTMATVSDVAHAFPNFGVANGNSCKGCHAAPGNQPPGSGSDRLDALAVLGEGLLDKDSERNDGHARGAIPFFTVEPGGAVDLTMQVLDGADAYAVQLKRFETAGVLGPADTDFLAGFTPDASWFPQGPSDPGPPVPNTYYTSVSGFDAKDWAGDGPEPWTFTLTVDPNTPENVYDLEFAVAGLNDTTHQKFYGDRHFYVVVGSEVPEPATLGLVLVGLGICLLKRRR